MALINGNSPSTDFGSDGNDSDAASGAPGAGASADPSQGAPANRDAMVKQEMSAVEAGESQGAGGFTIDVAEVRSKMQIPPQFQDAYQRLVIAGSKILFNPQTHALVMQHLDGQGPIAGRLGRGIAGLMLRVFRLSQYKAPAQVLIPAGVDLLVQACEYILKTKTTPLKPQDVADAVRVFVATMLVQFGGTPDKVKQQIGASGTADDSGLQIDRNADPDANGAEGADESDDGSSGGQEDESDESDENAPGQGLVNGQQQQQPR